MDNVRDWKNILLQWISECGFIELNVFNLEQTDIDAFYINVREKHHKIASSNHLNLLDFLQQFYPEFEAHCDDDNILSSADYIYVYTLLLHFSCVKYPQKFFHNICQKLPMSSQQIMGLLFITLLDLEKLNKDNLRHVIAKAMIKTPSISRSNSDPVITNNETDSPMRNIGSRRNSPLTTGTNLLEEQTHEDHKNLIQEIKELKIDVHKKSTENELSVIYEGNEDEQAYKRFIKEISQKDDEIMKLSETVRAAQDDKILAKEKLSYIEKQIEVYCKRIELLEHKMTDLNEELEKRDKTVKYLTDVKVELEEYITETRLAGLNASIESVSSISCISEVSSELTLIPSESENLAVSVIDKQLREKEQENIRIRDELNTLNDNNKLLCERIQELMKLEMSEFQLTFNESVSEMDISTNCDPYAQFNVFAKCMEKINDHHYVEKNMITKLAHEIEELLKKNLKLDSMRESTTLLQNNLNTMERNNKDLEETKECLQNMLCNNELELKDLKKQLEVEKCGKENSNEEVNALKVKLHQMEKTNAELTSSNVQLEAQIMDLQNQLQAMQKKWIMQTNRLEEQIKLYDDHSKELQLFQDENLSLKNDCEQALIRNENLKDNCRETIRNEIISEFGMEVTNLKKKNAYLESRIDILMKEHKEEKQQFQKDEAVGRERIIELDNEIFRMNEELTHFHILFESSDLEVIHLNETLEQMERGIIALIKLCSGNCTINNSANILKELEYHIKLLTDQNTVAVDRLETLEIAQQESNTNFNDLLKQAQEQERILNQRCINNTEDLLNLKEQNNEYEEKIEKLKDKQNQFIEQIKSDLMKKECELRQQLKDAKLEYEQSLNDLNRELKMEKERNNNKEKELLLLKAEHDELKSRLNEAEKEMHTLHKFNCATNINYERLHAFEVRVMEFSDDNDRFKREIQTLKQELSKTAQYRIDGDQIICKLKKEVKNCDSLKKQVNDLQGSLSQSIEAKEMLKHELEKKDKQIVELRESLNEQSQTLNTFNDTLIEMTKEKERLLKESNAFASRIQREQEEKSLLLSSLEKSTNRMRSEIQREESNSENLRRHNNEIKLQLESLQQQNEKLQNELSERKADFKALLEEQEQIKEDFQEKRTTLMNRLAESCDELANYHMSFAELVVTIENNVNLSIQMNEFRNIFNPCDGSADSNSINQLRQWINRLFHIENLQQSRIEQLLENEKQNLNTNEELIKENHELKFKIEQNQKEIDDVHKEMENIYSMMQKRITNEVKKMEEDILNLVIMNEHITDEKAALQSHINQQAEACQSANMKLDEVTAYNQELTLQLEKMKEEMEKLQVNYVPEQQYNNLEMEYKNLQEKCKNQQTHLHTLEAELSNKSKKISNFETTIFDMGILCKDLEKKIAFTTKKLDETDNDKLNAQLKCEQFRSECERYEKDIEHLKLQQENITNENNRVCSNISAEKDILRNEIEEHKANLLRANERASQKIASISMEKESACEENLSLRKQLVEMSKHQTNTEMKLSSLIERSQSWEQHFHASETELGSMKKYLEKSKANIERLKNENKKLRESQQVTLRRAEKTALKLGDAQARALKLERESETWVERFRGCRKEKDMMDVKLVQFKLRVAEVEKSHEQLLAKIENLERLNQTLQDARQKLEACEIDDKAKINKLEKVRETKEAKIRQLTAALNSGEQANVKLNLEIGALNSQLQELKLDLSANYNAQIEEMKLRLASAQEQAQKYAEVNQNSIIQINELEGQNAKTNEELSKVSLAMRISDERYAALSGEMEEMRANMLALRKDRTNAEQEQEILKQSLKEMHVENQELICERDSFAERLEKFSALLGEKMKQKTNKIENLECEIKELREKAEMQNLELIEGRKIAAKNVIELAELRTHLAKMEETLKSEQQSNERLRSDNQLLDSQYQEVKKHAAEVQANNEELIKKNILELEVSSYSSPSSPSSFPFSSSHSSISIYISCCLNVCREEELLFSITLLEHRLRLLLGNFYYYYLFTIFLLFRILSML
ncbi:uncharacterized protein ACN427_009793 isoform 2-T2 [Glossina fuscipes fuscipes]